MSKTSRSPEVVLVTGASSGIGACTARLFAERGARVVLAARSADKLERLAAELSAAGATVKVAATDLSDPLNAEPLVAAALSAFGRLDVLVNNAGYGAQRRFQDMPLAEVSRMFAVNVVSVMALARAAVAAMLPQGSGSIINVASVGGVVAHPLNVAYCATKHAVVGFSKSLRLELRGTGIGVTAICAGATRTEFFDRARADIPFDSIVDRFAAPPVVVGRAIVKASRRNRAVVFPTWSAWFLYALDRWLPALSAAGNIRYRDKVLAMAAQAEREE